MTHAIVQEETGGPQVLVFREVPDPVAGPGELVPARGDVSAFNTER